MRNIMAKYNYAFGYVKSFIFLDFLFAGIMMVVLGIVSIPAAIANGESTLETLAGGIISLIIGLLILFGVYMLFKSTLKKCPQSAKPVALALWMIIAGLLAAFAFAWWFFKHIIFPIIGMSAGSGNSGKFKYAQRYSTESAGYGQEWMLYGVCEDYAVLNDGHGNMLNVHPNNPDSSDGLVVDDSGNIYYPR